MVFAKEKICPASFSPQGFVFLFKGQVVGQCRAFLSMYSLLSSWGERAKGWDGIRLKNRGQLKIKSNHPLLTKSDLAKMDPYVEIQYDPKSMFIWTLSILTFSLVCVVWPTILYQGLNKKFDRSKFLAHLIIWAHFQSPHLCNIFILGPEDFEYG